MLWFSRHLNLTLLIALFIGYTLTSIGFHSTGLNVFVHVIAIVLMFVAQGWHLVKKDRSLGFMFLNLLGGVAYSVGSRAPYGAFFLIAGLIMLCLRNKRAAAK